MVVITLSVAHGRKQRHILFNFLHVTVVTHTNNNSLVKNKLGAFFYFPLHLNKKSGKPVSDNKIFIEVGLVSKSLDIRNLVFLAF